MLSVMNITEVESKPLLQREFGLVEEGACPNAAALFAVIIHLHSAPMLSRFPHSGPSGTGLQLSQLAFVLL